MRWSMSRKHTIIKPPEPEPEGNCRTTDGSIAYPGGKRDSRELIVGARPLRGAALGRHLHYQNRVG
jgi:hypothetical protein